VRGGLERDASVGRHVRRAELEQRRAGAREPMLPEHATVVVEASSLHDTFVDI
jgi:hypothetical protein